MPILQDLFGIAPYTNSKGISLLKHFEGLRLNPYHDVDGTFKVGYGCPLPDGVSSITQVYAEKLLKKTLRLFEKGVFRLLDNPLNQNQFSALTCFSFNVGLGNFERSTLLKAVNDERWSYAAVQFTLWNHVKGIVSEELLKRREAEKALFLTPCRS